MNDTTNKDRDDMTLLFRRRLSMFLSFMLVFMVGLFLYLWIPKYSEYFSSDSRGISVKFVGESIALAVMLISAVGMISSVALGLANYKMAENDFDFKEEKHEMEREKHALETQLLRIQIEREIHELEEEQQPKQLSKKN